MANIVFSVPHTGSRFTWQYLDLLKVVYRKHHTDKEAVEDLFYEEGSKLVIPMRDPLLCFISHCSIEANSKKEKLLNAVVDGWEILLSQLESFDHVYLRLDAPDQQGELRKVADFLGVEYKEMSFDPVGVTRNRPSDYLLWKRLKLKWGKPFSDEVISRLKPVRERYGY